MPIDASEYIRRVKIATQQTANSVAESRKFRAPTRDTAYDVNRIIKNSITLDDFKHPMPKHNTFAAIVLSANPSPTTG